MIADTFKTIVDKSDATDHRINDAFFEYAQERGFAIDPAHVRHPKDNGCAERFIRTLKEQCLWARVYEEVGICARR